jgi:uncharacterized membrane protein YgdD (TMEM256/DUF423 family)
MGDVVTLFASRTAAGATNIQEQWQLGCLLHGQFTAQNACRHLADGPAHFHRCGHGARYAAWQRFEGRANQQDNSPRPAFVPHMTDISDSAADTVDARSRWTGVFIGILAVLLAICSMGGDNASKDANRANIDATNTWAFFQAKNMRRQAVRLAIDDLQLRILSEPNMPANARTAVDTKLAEYKAQEQRLTSDPDKQEGLDELFVKGKALEAVRDAALAKDPYFDWAQALLQIGIVIASVSIISRSWSLLLFAAVLGVAGGLLMLDGFLMLMRLPFLG